MLAAVGGKTEGQGQNKKGERDCLLTAAAERTETAGARTTRRAAEDLGPRWLAAVNRAELVQDRDGTTIRRRQAGPPLSAYISRAAARTHKSKCEVVRAGSSAGQVSDSDLR